MYMNEFTFISTKISILSIQHFIYHHTCGFLFHILLDPSAYKNCDYLKVDYIYIHVKEAHIVENFLLRLVIRNTNLHLTKNLFVHQDSYICKSKPKKLSMNVQSKYSQTFECVQYGNPRKVIYLFYTLNNKNHKFQF